MKVLIDTNILTRSAQPSHSMHSEAVNAVVNLKVRGNDLFISPQNLVEFWAVATRPESANGLDMSTVEAELELTKIKSLFRLLDDNATIYPEWERIVVLYGVSGKNSHDARLVATMKTHGLTELLTFNEADFKRYSEIKVLSPSSVR
jgi:predicted nucleic acid-binding protein